MISAKDILGNPNFPAICYGGYRTNTRKVEPTSSELIEDLKIIHALGFRIIRTYQSKEFPQSANLIRAIDEIKKSDPNFEMYVMLGAWIECESAWTDNPNHSKGNYQKNKGEVDAAIELAKMYPDIVKIIAVGNESMVHWAATYFVSPTVVLNWVKYVQELKISGQLPEELWVTSSDNFASWGGGDSIYHNDALRELIKEVDYVSMHTYPFHDTHYNPSFWLREKGSQQGDPIESINAAMKRTSEYAYNQFKSTRQFIHSIDSLKPIHIGETGWATISNDNYGHGGSEAADEYKQKRYFDLTMEWTHAESISCFFFEAFDEPWKDSKDVNGSENHFGLITVDGKAKYLLWDAVDHDTFSGLGRNGKSIEKTFNGISDSILSNVQAPPLKG